MALPTSEQPPRQPAGSPWLFSNLQTNVRSMIAGSSVYSQSPNPSNHGTPKVPFRGLFRRAPPSPMLLPMNEPRDIDNPRSPLQPQHTAGSYRRAIAQHSDDEVPGPPRPTHGRRPSYVDPETQYLADVIHGRRRERRHKPKPKPKYRRAWIRRRKDRSVCWAFLRSKRARSKVLGCIISGIFLAVILSIYLCIALMRPHIGQEVHVLFILVILCTTIFFCHSLIRLCMLAVRPAENTPRIPNMTGPEGFRPIRPIPVRLARDDEVEQAIADGKETGGLKVPPPAYGLWRCSVRVDPNLLHWARAEDVPASDLSRVGLNPAHPHSPTREANSPIPSIPEEAPGPRPPSYVSEDGVSYVVDARARSIAPAPSTTIHALSPPDPLATPSEGYPRAGLGLSEVHPLYR